MGSADTRPDRTSGKRRDRLQGERMGVADSGGAYWGGATGDSKVGVTELKSPQRARGVAWEELPAVEEAWLEPQRGGAGAPR